MGIHVVAKLQDAEDEKLELNKLTIKQLAKSRRYWFGGEDRQRSYVLRLKI